MGVLQGKTVRTRCKTAPCFYESFTSEVNRLMKQTNIFKNFTDTVGFLGAVFALIAVFYLKNEFVATETVLSYKELESVKCYFFIAAVFIFSGIVNVTMRKFPLISLAVACLPLCVCYQIFAAKLLEKNPVFYIILTLIHASGALVYLFQHLEECESYVREGRISMISAYVLGGLAVDMWVSNAFISIKYEKLLKLPFRYFVCIGILGGVIGIVCYFKERRQSGSAPSTLFWNSFSAALVCAMILLARQTVGLFGI